MKIQSYQELNVWQKGVDIVDKIYALTDRYPQREMYGMSTQMQRAAVSVPANIAEGFARGHTKEYIQFLHISLGSCAELETHLIISGRRQYISQTQLNDILADLGSESRMLMGLIKSLRKRISG